MDDFRYRDGRLFCEDVAAEEIADRFGTPCYVYSARTIVDHYRKLHEAFATRVPTQICYSIKANSSLSILNLMAKEGAGFDAVSGGEIYRALKVGADPQKIVFAGVGKSDDEIRSALQHGILVFNVESVDEMENINRIAKELKKTASVALRVNPDVDPKTHKYITTGKRENKFGLDFDQARQLLGRVKQYTHVTLRGLHIHIGSQITSVEPYVESLNRLLPFLDQCDGQGIKIEWINLGGGFGIFYKDKAARTAQEMADAIVPILAKTGRKLLLEPGRFIVGNAGVLLTRILYTKSSGDKKFYICDAGMTDLIRPTLYGAYHKIWKAAADGSYSGEAPDEGTWKGETVTADVVGPICESGDFFAQDRRLPPAKRGDLLAVFSAGAYGYAMSSNYNSHPRSCEVMVTGKEATLITERETYEDLIKKEHLVDLRLKN